MRRGLFSFRLCTHPDSANEWVVDASEFSSKIRCEIQAREKAKAGAPIGGKLQPFSVPGESRCRRKSYAVRAVTSMPVFGAIRRVCADALRCRLSSCSRQTLACRFALSLSGGIMTRAVPQAWPQQVRIPLLN